MLEFLQGAVFAACAANEYDHCDGFPYEECGDEIDEWDMHQAIEGAYNTRVMQVFWSKDLGVYITQEIGDDEVSFSGVLF